MFSCNLQSLQKEIERIYPVLTLFYAKIYYNYYTSQIVLLSIQFFLWKPKKCSL